MVEIKQGEADVTERAQFTLDVRPQIGAVYPLADARDAYMAKSTQYLPGTVVLTP